MNFVFTGFQSDFFIRLFRVSVVLSFLGNAPGENEI